MLEFLEFLGDGMFSFGIWVILGKFGFSGIFGIFCVFGMFGIGVFSLRFFGLA